VMFSWVGRDGLWEVSGLFLERWGMLWQLEASSSRSIVMRLSSRSAHAARGNNSMGLILGARGSQIFFSHEFIAYGKAGAAAEYQGPTLWVFPHGKIPLFDAKRFASEALSKGLDSSLFR